MKSKVKRKKVYFITVVIGLAICMVGVIFGSRLVFQRICERRTTPWSDLGTADDDEYRILIDAYGQHHMADGECMTAFAECSAGKHGKAAAFGQNTHISVHQRQMFVKLLSILRPCNVHGFCL